LLPVANFHQGTYHSRLSEQFSESQAATWKPEQASRIGLLEGFLELLSDFKEAFRNFILNFSIKGNQMLLKP
jgi:hypothetical protein